jgi:hypothetical protein
MANQVLPIVRLFFPCDSATLDLADNKWTLKNPWHTVGMPAGLTERFIQPEIWLYAQLTDGLGKFNLVVEMRDSESQTIIGRSRPEPRDFQGGQQLLAVEVVFKMTNVPFPRPGVYEFKLLGNYAPLDGGSAFLRVLPG